MHETTPSMARVWLLAMRPKTLSAAAMPVIVGSALAWSHEKFAPLAMGAALAVAFFIQIGTNFANDLFDFLKGTDDEERLGPLRVTSAGLVSPRQIGVACALAFGLAFVSGLYLVWLGGWWLLVLGLVSILSGVAYTGGPFPLAYNALGDLFVFVFFGLVATVGTYYVQALALPPEAFAYGAVVGCLSTAILIVNNLRDLDGDALHGKTTTAVLLGPTLTRIFYLLVVTLAFVIPVVLVFLGRAEPLVLAALLGLPMACVALKNLWSREGRALNAVLGQTSLVLLITCVCMAVGLVL